MNVLLAADETLSSMQVTTWLQIMAGIASLIGTAAYVGMKIGRMETKIDSHFKILESIATRLEKDFSNQEKAVNGHAIAIQTHEVQLTALEVQIGHLEQQISGKKPTTGLGTVRKAHT